MSFRNAPFVLALVALLGCGPGQRLASSSATYQRYELSADAYPESVPGWYQCFEQGDDEYRKLCLARTPGVRVAEGPGLVCVGNLPFDLCRAFPVYAVPEDEGASTVDDDNAGAAIANAFGQLLVGIIRAAADSDDDDDDEPERDRASSDGQSKERHSARSERRRPEKAHHDRRPSRDRPKKGRR